ncbi:DNA-binding transcriptional response regulator, NtrC family, contains REC, AAA-type ATPase, and a Fis-type DNA-binding domains [Chitinophaga sp. YR627]|nr:DNA-binding transcriptional response regulator, NtrC family, contains REC, AAA-type ATPase, and a Fis-type DNA-binding domains [Chitinophaga sp. YR627]
MLMRKILIVEDEFIEAKNLQRMLIKAGYEVSGIANSVEQALSLLKNERPDFVLIDIFLRGTSTGVDLGHMLRSQHVPFLYLSANSNKSTLDKVKSTRPYGFLVKPCREKDVLAMLEIAIYQHENRLPDPFPDAALPKDLLIHTGASDTASYPAIIGQSETLQQTMRKVHMVAPSDSAVMILGESGTGKEMIAQALHVLSPRKKGPFIKINCAALPVTLIESILFGHEKGSFTGAAGRYIGKFEQADKGTLFLDEIGEVPFDVQAKLLRTLQEKEIERLGGSDTIKINVRIIAATNRDLEKEMAEGRFRIDLYYRLNVFPIYLSPLRQRGDDILLLANHFKDKFCLAEGKSPFEIPSSVTDKLLTHPWPGNIRELESAMRRLVLLYSVQQEGLAEAVLQPQIQYKEPPSESTLNADQDVKTWHEYERHYILHTLKKCKGKISGENGAAKLLDLPPSTLESKMKRLGIKKGDY